MLPLNLFKLALEHLPLFAIDLLIINEQNEILLGKRVNAPAKGYWFVPGGRVFKNESLSDAFGRITKAELGIELPYVNASLIGLYDHFYSDSVISDDISTHYINAAHVIKTNFLLKELPNLQHADYRWVAVHELDSDPDVHLYSKVFLHELKEHLKNADK
jgi:colanic acid biosynthesis protein WcaH